MPVLDCGGLFKAYELNKVKALDEEIENMDALTLNYWLSKFVMEGDIHREQCMELYQALSVIFKKSKAQQP